MKRKILIITSSLTLAIAIALTITLNTHKNGLSDLALANVEALAQAEHGEDGKCGRAAYEYDNDFYEDTKNFRICGDCVWVEGTKPQYMDC